VLAILILFFFAVVYWTGAGQYGNAINLWADQNTNRYVAGPAPPVDVYPEASETTGTGDDEVEGASFWQRYINMFQLRPKKQTEGDESWSAWWTKLWNPVPTTWFQSINPVMILVLAPLFALLWTRLDRGPFRLSIPAKMALGLVFMALSFVVMLGAASGEARQSSVQLSSGGLPAALTVNDRGQVCRAEKGKPPLPYDASRLFYDRSTNSLRAVGVFPDLVRDDIVRDTVPASLAKQLDDLTQKTAEAAAGQPNWSVQVQLDPVPADFDLRYAGLGSPTGNKDVRYNPQTRTLTIRTILEEKDIKGLKVAAGDASLRASLNELMQQADASRVSPWWLVGFFLLATMGELCLTPVGLSMVSQLAPARFATMLMGLWLLTWAFANFLAGAFGEQWGTWTPLTYFWTMLVILGGATIVLFLLARKVGALMHEEAK
jgi:POT family proton-dependent oligopeptide transporter